jgi:hypothetical protein
MDYAHGFLAYAEVASVFPLAVAACAARCNVRYFLDHFFVSEAVPATGGFSLLWR